MDGFSAVKIRKFVNFVDACKRCGLWPAHFPAELQLSFDAAVDVNSISVSAVVALMQVQGEILRRIQQGALEVAKIRNRRGVTSRDVVSYLQIKHM